MAIEAKLPRVSTRITGQLMLHNHGVELHVIPIFNCDDKAEQERFQVAMAVDMSTKLFDSDETIEIVRATVCAAYALPSTPPLTVCTSCACACLRVCWRRRMGSS